MRAFDPNSPFIAVPGTPTPPTPAARPAPRPAGAVGVATPPPRHFGSRVPWGTPAPASAGRSFGRSSTRARPKRATAQRPRNSTSTSPVFPFRARCLAVTPVPRPLAASGATEVAPSRSDRASWTLGASRSAAVAT